MFKNPRAQVTEQVVIESNGRDKFKIRMADYWLRRAFAKPETRVPTEVEKKKLMKLTSEILQQAEAGNIDFFKQAYFAQRNDPDYFGWKKYMLAEAKNPKRAIETCNLLSRNQVTSKKIAGVGRICFRMDGPALKR